MTLKHLIEHIEEKQSLLSVSIEPIIEIMPQKFKSSKSPLFNFAKSIVDNTHKYTIAFKINTAFFEAFGSNGWAQLENIAHYIKQNYPKIFLIADAKRSDVLQAAKMYAKAFFENMPFDAITINPYLGKDSVKPFLDYNNKWVIIIGLSSNPSAWDIQLIQEIDTRDYVFEKVFKYGAWWGDENKIMFITGATFAYKLQQIRYIVPNHFLIVPEINNYNDINEICLYGLNQNYGLILNLNINPMLNLKNNIDFEIYISNLANNFQKHIKKQLYEFKKNYKPKRYTSHH